LDYLVECGQGHVPLSSWFSACMHYAVIMSRQHLEQHYSGQVEACHYREISKHQFDFRGVLKLEVDSVFTPQAIYRSHGSTFYGIGCCVGWLI